MKGRMAAATVAMIGVMLLGFLLSGGLRQEPFDIGEYSHVDIGQAEAAFAASQDNGDLLLLVKALCWRYEAMGDASAGEALARYGQILLDRAKAETIDLEQAGPEDVMLPVLQVIRGLGVR